jgi:iron complex outermembrane receptor protein
MSRTSNPFRHSAVALALAGAFSAAPAATTANPPAAAASAAAANAGTPGTQSLDTVTVKVNARRRLEAAQDVPAALTVINGSELEKAHIDRIQDFQQLLPDTNVDFIHSRQASFAIRGIGNNPASDGLDASSGIYLDDVFLGRPGMAVLDILDVDQIELLRGPQGTLFGKNTTAGVLSITTAKPTFTDQGSAELSVGQRGNEQFKLIENGALSDTLAGRILLYGTHDDGDIHDLATGQTLNGGIREGARGQLLFVPDASFDLRLIGDANREVSSYGTMVPYYFGPTFLSHITAGGATNVPTQPTAYSNNFNSPQQSNDQQGGLSAEANWHFDSGATLTSVSAWRKWNFQPLNDGDASNADGILTSGFNVNDSQFSQEFRLASKAGGSFDYVAGLYGFHQHLENEQFTEYGPNANYVALGSSTGPLNNVTSFAPGEITTDSVAAFGQTTWHIEPRLDLTAGLRGTQEEKYAEVTREAPIGATPAAASLASLRAWSSGQISVDNFAPSTLVNLAYKVQPNLLGYATFSTGEKSGGVNLQATSSAVANNNGNLLIVGPEKAKNVELGVKYTAPDQRLIANVDVFATNIDGYQANEVVPDPTSATGYSNDLTNVGSIRTQGLEWDFRELVARGLNLNFNGSYDDAYYTSFANAPCPAEIIDAGHAPATCNLTGHPIVGAPRWTLNPGASYDWNTASGLKEYVSGTYSWRSWSEGTIDDSKYSQIPAYGVLNLSTGWKTPRTTAGGWEASLWVRNAFDKRYFTGVFQSPLAADAYTAAVGLPRTIGATVKFDF